jgi:hypothetical protein
MAGSTKIELLAITGAVWLQDRYVGRESEGLWQVFLQASVTQITPSFGPV